VSLQITYSELRREIGRFLGYDRDPDNWDATQTADVADILNAGMRAFYWPNVGESRYSWSFLRKLGSLSVSSGTAAYELATDFEGLLTGFSYQSGSQKRRVSRVPEEEILAIIGKDLESGPPEFCALRAKEGDGTDPTLWEVLFMPTPDASYTLSYRYSRRPDVLSSTQPYHLGGAAVSECVLEACLAAAEKTMSPEKGPGIHAERFQQLLQAAVKIDAEMQ